jgi:hypothetical protein
MALLGKAAMLLSFDVAQEAIVEHDDWHTHEHIPERVSIPGFMRGSRWIAEEGQPRYFVMYEVAGLDILASAAYLERLNNPTPWTAKMMVHYLGMTRGFCTITNSFGVGLGQAAVLIRFKPEPGKAKAVHKWLCEETLPGLPSKAGLASAHLFDAALTPQTTKEQRIRGKDAAIDCALLVTGYSADSVAKLIQTELCEHQFENRGASGVSGGFYRMAYSLAEGELPAPNSSLNPEASPAALTRRPLGAD